MVTWRGPGFAVALTLSALAALTTGGGGDAVAVPQPASAEQVATALRSGEWEKARALLDAGAPPGAPATPRTRLLLGLAAWQRESFPEAERWLDEGRGGDPELEDWRLLLLAEAAATVGHRPQARAALTTLLEDHRDSLLRSRARLRLAELAAAEGQSPEVEALVAAARAEGQEDGSRIAIEALAFTLAQRGGALEPARQAAVQLLVLAPLEASRLQVIAALHRGSGEPAWNAILTPAELVRRARHLLEVELASAAATALDAVPSAARDLDWHCLRARTAIAERHPEAAVALLAPLTATTPAEAAQLAWARAQAARAAATVERGRPVPSLQVRTRLRTEARGYLHLAAAQATAEPGIARLALRELWGELADEERFDDGIAVLQRLLALDPIDTTGAKHLWARGWRDYRVRNYTGAIGTWTHLRELYGRTSYARSARYWSGRAWAALGDSARAEAIFREVAAGTPADFYARQAAARLRGVITASDDEASAREPWPEDPTLARARRLTDVGLDEIALAELDLRAPAAASRAANALRGVVLARLGERRESLRLLRRAFPMLGTAWQGQAPAEAVALFYPRDFEATITRQARAQGLPVPLVFALIHQESAFDATAQSRSGARGLMQVMPTTGRLLARRLQLPFSPDRLYDPEYSVQLGTAYLRSMLGLFGGNVELALASYNGGPGRIGGLWRRAGPNPELDTFLEDLALEEPKTYVKRIVALADGYRRLHPDLG